MAVDKIGAWVVESIEDLRSRLVPCRDQATVHISRSCETKRFAWQGVPAMSCDVLIDRRMLEHAQDELPLVVTLARKAGKYDWHIRDRWLVRRMNAQSTAKLPRAELLIRIDDAVSIRVLSDDRVVAKREYRRLPTVTTDYDQWSCVRRNWTRYFQHLDWSQVEAAQSEFIARELWPGDTISELNIHCTAWLTDLSYQLGWQRWIQAAANRKGKPLWNRAEDAASGSGRYETAEEYYERVEAELCR